MLAMWSTWEVVLDNGAVKEKLEVDLRGVVMLSVSMLTLFSLIYSHMNGLAMLLVPDPFGTLNLIIISSFTNCELHLHHQRKTEQLAGEGETLTLLSLLIYWS